MGQFEGIDFDNPGRHYILKDGKVLAVPLLEWAAWFETADRHVADTTIGDVRVSTVFLGIDHGFHPGNPPVLFETMVFGGVLDGEQDRYHFFQQAEQGHEAMCDRVRGSVK